ncbi:hypothetical protein F4777DRAFT_340828 [Nemania sp. FL0916]|nr:hypothetical protein F4777DRAFT_340828 [Nemania sp. FL0916]
MYEITPPPDQEWPKAIGVDRKFLLAETLRFQDMTASDFAFALLSPSAKKIQLVSCVWDTAFEMPLSNAAGARSIILEETKIDELGLFDILAGLPQLHTLVYCRPSDEVDTQFDLYGNVLWDYGKRLQHLTMLNESGMSFSSPIGSLKNLICLQTLEIDLELLVGFQGYTKDEYDDEYDDSEYDDSDYVKDENSKTSDPQEESYFAGSDWCLVDILPGSLEKLTLRIEDEKLDAYFNTYESYGAKIEQLLTAQNKFPWLYHISAPRLAEVAKRLGDGYARWNLTTQWIMERSRSPISTGSSVSEESTTDTMDVDED